MSSVHVQQQNLDASLRAVGPLLLVLQCGGGLGGRLRARVDWAVAVVTGGGWQACVRWDGLGQGSRTWRCGWGISG